METAQCTFLSVINSCYGFRIKWAVEVELLLALGYGIETRFTSYFGRKKMFRRKSSDGSNIFERISIEAKFSDRKLFKNTNFNHSRNWIINTHLIVRLPFHSIATIRDIYTFITSHQFIQLKLSQWSNPEKSTKRKKKLKIFIFIANKTYCRIVSIKSVAEKNSYLQKREF